MTNTPNIIGKWSGTYKYKTRNGFEKENLTPVDFEIEIQTIENDSFNGNVEDKIEMGGTPGVGSINGTFNQNLIEFEKKMPVNAMHLQNGERKINKNNTHPTIVYSGKIDTENMTISGNWKFKKSPKFMWIKILPWWYDLGSGTFTMKKTF